MIARLAANPGWVGGSSNNHKVIVHHKEAVDAKPESDEFLFFIWRVKQNYIRISLLANLQRLPAAHCYKLNVIACFLSKCREQHIQQT